MMATRGGEYGTGLAVAAALQALPARLLTYNLSRIASAGTLVYLAGETRVVTPGSEFGFHGGIVTAPAHEAAVKFDTNQLRNLLETAATADATIAHVLRERCGLGDEDVAELLQPRLVRRDAAWAVRHRIAHAIETPKIPVGGRVIVASPRWADSPAPNGAMNGNGKAKKHGERRQ
jgi:hypothetical protein